MLGQDPVNGRSEARAVPSEPLPAEHWRLQTEDTCLTVAVVNNRPAIYELKNPTQGWNWTNTHAAIALPTKVVVASLGDYLSATWKYRDATTDHTDGTTVILTFTCDQAPKLSLKSIWQAAPGPGPIQYTEVVENKTGHSVSLYPRLESLDISVKSDRGVGLWRFHKDGGGRSDATGVYQNLLTDGANYEAPIIFDAPDASGGVADWIAGHGFIPLVVLDSGDHGLYVGWEWQIGRLNVSATGTQPAQLRVRAGYKDADRSEAGQRALVLLSGKLKGKFAAPDHTEVPDQKLELGTVYLGAYRGDVDDGTNRLKRWYFNHKPPLNVRTDPHEPWTQFATGSNLNSKPS